MSTIEEEWPSAAGRNPFPARPVRRSAVPGRGAALSLAAVAAVAAAGALLGTASCSKPGDEFVIETKREVAQPSRRAFIGATSEQRFGSSMGAPAMGGSAPQAAGDTAADEPPLHWTTPPGWAETPSTSRFRIANHEVGGDPRAECYVSMLPGNAGGLLENINRWRSQMGAEPIAENEIERLETVDVLGRPAFLVDVEGTFSGMGQGVEMPDFRLIGAILPSSSGGMLFVKMTGPSALLDAERQSFIDFCASLHMAHDGDHGAGEPDAAAPRAVAESDTRPVMPADPPVPGMKSAGPLSWSVPDGWNEQSARPMRAVSFELGPQRETECYVSILAGPAGGRDANLNRWRQQMGLDALSSLQVEALPEVEILGSRAKLLEAYGNFSGMGDTMESAGLLGVICTVFDDTVFIKMIGPAEDVRAGKQAFIEFCASLEVNG